MFTLITALFISGATAGPRGCLTQDSPERLLSGAKAILNEQKITFREIPDNKLEILPDANGSSLNRTAARFREKYRSKVLLSPADLICGASADTDPSDVCALSVFVGQDVFRDAANSSTMMHEEVHLVHAAPAANEGFDSLFFGRISNLDGTNHGAYPSFALDEIAAYSTELIYLEGKGTRMSKDAKATQSFSARTHLGDMLTRTRTILDRHLRLIGALRSNTKSFSVIDSEGDIAVTNLRAENEPAVIFKHGDYRGSGQVNYVTFVDGRDQLTLPLFKSALDLKKTARLIGPSKVTLWPLAPVAAEIKEVEDRLKALRVTVSDMESALKMSDFSKLENTLRKAERHRDLGLTKWPCPMINPIGAESGAAPASH